MISSAPAYGRRGGRRSLAHRPSGPSHLTRYDNQPVTAGKPRTSNNIWVVITAFSLAVFISIFESLKNEILKLFFILIVLGIVLGIGIGVLARKSGQRTRYLPSGSRSSYSQPSYRRFSDQSSSKISTGEKIMPRHLAWRRCTDCNNRIEPGDMFCSSCGARLVDKTASPASLSCTHCGTPLVETDSNCPECGKAREKCEICKRWIRSGDVIGSCNHCQRTFHYAHLKEVSKVLGKCPACKQPLKEDDIGLNVV